MRWHFFRDESGWWRWEQELHGDTITRAISGFAEKAECIADARKYGFGCAQHEQPAHNDREMS